MKKSILFTIDALYGGGAEKVLITLLRGLDRERFDIDLFLFSKSGVYVAQVPSDVRVFHLFDSAEKPGNFVFRLFRRITRSVVIRLLKFFPFLFRLFVHLPRKYDLGVSFCEGLNVCLLEGIPEKFKKRISWVHTHIEKHKFVLSKNLFLRAVAAFDKVVFVARNCMEVFQNVCPSFPASKMLCLYNPLDVAGIVLKGAEPCNFFEGRERRFRLVTVGRLSPEKRFDRLLKTVGRLCAEGFPVELLILGDGKERANLTALAAALGISGHVTFAPFCENPYAWMSRADVFVSSSDYEGLPLVVEEAMILGLPIVATRTLGAAEILEGGKFGILVDFSADALYDGILTMLNHPETADEFRKKLLAARAKNRFLFPPSSRDIEDFLAAETAVAA